MACCMGETLQVPGLWMCCGWGLAKHCTDGDDNPLCEFTLHPFYC